MKALFPTFPKLARIVLGLALCAGILVIGGCDDDDDVANPAPDNPEEVITTVNLTFTPLSGGAPVTAQFRDPDGDGGADPTVTAVVLSSGNTYDLTVELLNETVDPSDEEYNIGEEIKEEAEEHQFFFTGNAISGGLLTFTYADRETDYTTNEVGDDLPVGLAMSVTAHSSGSGQFTITLQHLPPVNNQPVKTIGADLNDGETDIEVTFDVTVL